MILNMKLFKNPRFWYAVGVNMVIIGIILLLFNAIDYIFSLSILPAKLLVPSGIVMNIFGFFIAGKFKRDRGI